MTRPILLPLFAFCSLVFGSATSRAEDIDIYTGGSGTPSGNPNVLIVLDNTSNWAQAAQKWPDFPTQGQAEVNAIATVLDLLPDNVLNVGLMMYVTGSSSGPDGGYIRQHVVNLDATSKASFKEKLLRIFNNINDPSEKVSSNMPYGNILFDVFKYFGGFTSPDKATLDEAGSPTDSTHFGPICFADPVKVPTTLADALGYTTTWSKFGSPINETNNCAPIFLIFIGNGFPNADDPKLLSNVLGNTAQLLLPDMVKSGTGFVPKGTYSAPTPTNIRYADEWTRFLFSTDVSPMPGQQKIVTYTVDVYNAKQDADQTALLMNMARHGGGTYFAARSVSEIVDALKRIFIDIQSVNSSYASTALPVSASNRAENANQVYIPMFRPDPDAKPRWFGNLKRYQLALIGGNLELADQTGNNAINTATGFVSECATSWWTTESPIPGSTAPAYYWENWLTSPPPISACANATNPLSDAPDGPWVEKGAVGEVLRKGNNPPTTNATPTWSVANRNIKTLVSGSWTTFNTTNVTSLDATTVNFIRGEDSTNEALTAGLTKTRPAIQGDVIHSRPLPVDYGASGVTVYYGSNDGMLRAVDGTTGKERWAFVAPEFYSRLGRLKDNCPAISYPSIPAGTLLKCKGVDTPLARKDYFFDGSIGLYQALENKEIWIYPTQRRGGRMVYGFDVTVPDSPLIKWRIGCPNLTNDSDCTTDGSFDMKGLGQTWSAAYPAFIKGYSTETPVVVMGGGYDNCEDTDTLSPPCSAAKGRAVLVVDGKSGTVVRAFSTDRSVAGDIAMIDVDHDGRIDYGYAADTGGNIYRIGFVKADRTPLASGDWTFHKVAHTGGSRKFLFAPALVYTRDDAGKDYVYLAIGSGDREHPLSTNTAYSSITNKFFVYLDDVSGTTDTNLDDTSVVLDCTAAAACKDKPLIPGNPIKGWSMVLNQYGAGEQTVTSALIVGGEIVFSTNRPIPPDPLKCSGNLGEARGYWVNLLTSCGAIGGTSGACDGNRSNTFVGGGLPPSPIFANVKIGDESFTVVFGAVPKDGSAGVGIKPTNVTFPVKGKRKRIYWYNRGDN